MFRLFARLDTQPQPRCNRRAGRKGYNVSMNEDVESLKLVVQETLDELLTENLIPFGLSVQEVKSIGMEEYIIHFHDSWLPSLDVSWPEGKTFKVIFRTALLDRIARIRNPPRLTRRRTPSVNASLLRSNINQDAPSLCRRQSTL